MTDLPTSLTERLPPYARAMGMRINGLLDGAPLLVMDYSQRAMGRPGYLHGGAIAGLLEMAAIMALHADLGDEDTRVRIKPVNISVEYLRGGATVETFARGQVVRAGRRIANVRAEAWQADRDKPLASCWMNFLIKPKA
ncbi:MAG: phenylacetic acid degradation protein [Novosphingobium sp. 16-62-11]|uniref:PaaI family thioesterase n=1 Tax=Novosphingobium sp. 17-62-19 TaxID=1970406 RepID=UPI000BCF6877|nr:PaaI family thioesterase [Novosphingobium sp. 17-62-19]OYX95580.1 MAG: phenylacetic acid degradation protein [Novosphingobium sp. 35-62-5]OYZ46680.1 MAG: phenylacetic acid degradation protein [Novosphingobium sp. 16-62-11]OZA62076.1 MAG: phenylacetic acid degradation protein [Sphingomonadales bacterium 39-62-4]HQS97196.1 PaaI family thioesterase [Novosphingobium sp.]OZA18116.1 MAG: phenylacetic acid degradation protein [Novosphingobium sp. 17-62-19]